MKLSSRTARRIGATTAAICAAILVPAVALAAPGHPAAAARAPGCSVADLRAWVGIPADGSAGTFTYQLELSNISGHACTLLGFPGVSATGAQGRQLGTPAVRNYSHPARLVTLNPRATAHVELGIIDVSNYPKLACHAVTATGLRVFPPNDRRSESIPISFRACQKPGPKYLSVTTAIAGTGIPAFSS